LVTRGFSLPIILLAEKEVFGDDYFYWNSYMKLPANFNAPMQGMETAKP